MPDHRSVRACHRRPHAGACAKCVPERQRADKQQEARQEDRKKGERRAGDPVRAGFEQHAEIGGEGE
jgi:hypothetical protein